MDELLNTIQNLNPIDRILWSTVAGVLVVFGIGGTMIVSDMQQLAAAKADAKSVPLGKRAFRDMRTGKTIYV